MRSFIPTPSHSAVAFGIFTIHYYALCILLGTFIAIAVGRRRYAIAGGEDAVIVDIAIYAIPAGILGGRLYHLLTSPERYFGAHGNFVDALRIWDGGMGIWGAIALGTLISFWRFRALETGRPFGELIDALAPGILIAQGIGRFGNWFNGELFGRPTSLPWGLEIPEVLRPLGYEGYKTFHPTFLYEALWCFLAALLLIKIWPKISMITRLKSGSTFLGYISLYCFGRLWVELLRIDESHRLVGIRFNIWVSLLGFFISSGILISRMLRVADENSEM